MAFRAKAHVDLNALAHNFNCVKTLAPSKKIMSMIKSNGYGHGLLPVAKALNASDAFGVACLSEAITLRQAGIKQPIILMSGMNDLDELAAIDQHQLSLVIHEYKQIKLLQHYTFKNSVTIWLKIDTGMHRLGFAPGDFKEAYYALSSLPYVEKLIHLMSHFADADDIDKSTTTVKSDVFFDLTRGFQNPKSLANSAGIIAWPETHADWVRPGIMLYGASPMVGLTGEKHQLKPVMTLQARLIAIHELNKGDAVGYGGTWRCPADARVGVVSVGYGDGYPRHARHGTPVWVNGTLCPLVGRVSMDMITVDLSSVVHAEVGDVVILWGKGLPVETVAVCADTISYELFCNVSQRVQFDYS